MGAAAAHDMYRNSAFLCRSTVRPTTIARQKCEHFYAWQLAMAWASVRLSITPLSPIKTVQARVTKPSLLAPQGL